MTTKPAPVRTQRADAWAAAQASRAMKHIPSGKQWEGSIPEMLEVLAAWHRQGSVSILDQLRGASRGYRKSTRARDGSRGTPGVYVSPTEAAVLGAVSAEESASDFRLARPDPDEVLLAIMGRYLAAMAELARCQRLLATGSARKTEQRKESDCLRCLADVTFKEMDGSRCRECHGTGLGNADLMAAAGPCIVDSCGRVCDGRTDTTRLKHGLCHPCAQSWYEARSRGMERGDWLARRRSFLEAK